MGVDRLSQTRPIARSPDGDRKHGKGFRVDVYKNDYRNVQIHVMMILELGIIVASNDNGW